MKPIVADCIKVEIATRADLPSVAVSEAALRDALLNLCVNARDAMPTGGMLRLATDLVDPASIKDLRLGRLADSETPCVAVSVQDTGQGMPPGVLECVFDPFFTTKATGVGTGLGLAIVAQFVLGAHGAIGVSTRENRGTAICLYLPIALAEMPLESEKHPAEPRRVATPIAAIGDSHPDWEALLS